MSPGLLRARRQFRTKNAVAGAVLLAFVAGVFSYSMAAVKQDVFDDLDDEAKERAVLDAKRAALTVEDEKRAMAAAASYATAPATKPLKLSDRARNNAVAPVPEASTPEQITQRRGVLASLLDGRFPWLLDPTRKTLVWGAPPVDKVGSLGDKSKSV
jgi:cytochrome c oxidase assembly factor 3